MRVPLPLLTSASNKEGTGELDKKIDKLYETLQFGKDAERFKELRGKQLDLESSKDLGILLYDILEYPPILTDKGNRSVDEKALNKINLYFVKDLLKFRKLLKVRGTYLAQFKRFSYNGKMNPSYDLTIPKSYRGSSSDPNFQNIPKRDEYSKMVCRKGIIPRAGHGLLSSDFSGIEVAIAACYNKDPELLKYITDERTDMHRDAAADVWKLPHEEVTKEIRYSGKNGWVFPQFYGSYYGNCAPDLWDNYLKLKTASGVPLKKHLSKKGIKNVEAFTEHCKKVEQKFWGQRFRVYKKWKEAINKEYRERGYIITYLGFQFVGYMTQNECTNYQTQGTAFHMLMWTLMEMEKIAEDRRWESYIIGQIHDDMIHDYVEEELDEIVEAIDIIGTNLIREQFPWVIIPLKIEHETSGIDGNWAEMEEYNYG
jgi:DNA polymerase-1